MVYRVYCNFRIPGFGFMDELRLRNLDVKLRRVQGLGRKLRDLAMGIFKIRALWCGIPIRRITTQKFGADDGWTPDIGNAYRGICSLADMSQTTQFKSSWKMQSRMLSVALTLGLYAYTFLCPVVNPEPSRILNPKPMIKTLWSSIPPLDPKP